MESLSDEAMRCRFALDSLHLPLSQPQRDHLLHLVDGSLVCEERKTLAALQRQFLDSTDPSNWADFLRISLDARTVTNTRSACKCEGTRPDRLLGETSTQRIVDQSLPPKEP